MCATCFGLYVSELQASQYKNHVKEDTIRPQEPLRMAETCSLHGRVTNWIKLNLCCVRLNKCGLFNNKHNGMASITNVCIS